MLIDHNTGRKSHFEVIAFITETVAKGTRWAVISRSLGIAHE